MIEELTRRPQRAQRVPVKSQDPEKSLPELRRCRSLLPAYHVPDRHSIGGSASLPCLAGQIEITLFPDDSVHEPFRHANEAAFH